MSAESDNAPMKIALCGIGGYGASYIPFLLNEAASNHLTFVGGVDPYPERSQKLNELKAANIPIYPSMDALWAHTKPDLTILSTPIGLHATQTEFAVKHGSHVLCEKPIAATPAEAARMRAARDATGKHVAIGYQWSYSKAVQALKADALAGVFGKLRRMRTVVLWPRDEVYYGRNDWAGAIKNTRGDWVLDSPVNNACAHHLHHMLYVAGSAVDRSATPTKVTGEFYRANPIQNFDTAALRLKLPGDAEALFYVTHAGQKAHNPAYIFEFEHATIESRDEHDAHITATFKDGTKKDYGTPATDYRDGKVIRTINAIRSGEPTLCGIEAATPHCQVVWACQKLIDRIKTFPADQIKVVGESPKRNSVPGMDDVLMNCFAQGKLPSESNVPWATPAASVDVEPA